MSKERARARAAREADAARRAARHESHTARETEQRRRRERRDLLWRQTRLWQHGSGFRRNKERWALLATLAMLMLLLAYLLTGSYRAVLMMFLVLVIAGPALAMITFGRRHR